MVPKNNDVSVCTQPTTADDSDMLSKLPTDVLVSILDKLSLRDAIRAGVLSRQWRHLPGQLSRLVLDIDDYFCDDDDDEYYDEDDPTKDLLDKKPVDDDGHTSTVCTDDGDALSAAGNKMVDVATALLASRAACLPTLAMSFLLRHNYMSLGRLLDDAMAGGKVQAAELTVSTMSRIGIDECDGDIIRAMAGYGRRFDALFDGCPAAFAGLTRLTMEKMTMVRESVLDDILATCKRLEFLSLEACDPGQRTTQWRVRHARLADLRITFCVFGEVHLVWLPSLERFAYRYNEFHTQEPLSFGHVPRLTMLTVSHNHDVVYMVKLSKIFANTAVKDLRLNFSVKDIWVQPEAPKRLIDVFRSLKYLKLHNIHEECGLNWTMFLLQAAPFLKELYIKLWWDHECNMQRDVNKKVPWDVPKDFKHYSLTRITIQGFYSSKDLLATYMCRLVGAAINLEELRMSENTTCKECNAARARFPRIDEDRECLVKRITHGASTHFKIHIVQS